MQTTLWENRLLRIWKVVGTVSSVSTAFREPEGVDYSINASFHRFPDAHHLRALPVTDSRHILKTLVFSKSLSMYSSPSSM